MIPHDAGKCSDLLPPDWLKEVPAEELPSVSAAVGDWVTLANSLAGDVDTEHDHYVQGVGIVKRCEDRDAAVTAHLTKPWYAFWR